MTKINLGGTCQSAPTEGGFAMLPLTANILQRQSFRSTGSGHFFFQPQALLRNRSQQAEAAESPLARQCHIVHLGLLPLPQCKYELLWNCLKLTQMVFGSLWGYYRYYCRSNEEHILIYMLLWPISIETIREDKTYVKYIFQNLSWYLSN